MCAMAAMPYRLADDSLTDDFDPPLIVQSAVNASLNAAIESAPPISSKLIRRSTDGALVASIISVKAVPVAGVYTRQLEIYEETIRLDDVIARVFTGPEVNDALSPYAAKGVNMPGLRVFTFNHFLLYWQQDAILTDELVTNLTFAGIGVLVVCMLALANPAALIAVSGVGIVDIFLFASLIIGEFIFMFTRAIRLTSCFVHREHPLQRNLSCELCDGRRPRRGLHPALLPRVPRSARTRPGDSGEAHADDHGRLHTEGRGNDAARDASHGVQHEYHLQGESFCSYLRISVRAIRLMTVCFVCYRCSSLCSFPRSCTG